MLVRDAASIAALRLDEARENFRMASERALTALCPKLALHYDAIARASEERVARLVECDFRLLGHLRNQHPLDRASKVWRDQRKANAK